MGFKMSSKIYIHLKIQNATLLGKRVLADVVKVKIKMRLYESVLMKETEWTRWTPREESHVKTAGEI